MKMQKWNGFYSELETTKRTKTRKDGDMCYFFLVLDAEAALDRC